MNYPGKVSLKGQITIPKKIRNKLGVAPGDFVLFTEEKGAVVLKKARISPEEEFNKLVTTLDKKIEKLGITDQDIEDAISFFSSIRGQELTVDQIERILCFWEKCVVWAQTLPNPPKSLLSALSRLIRYVTTFGDREIRLLMAVAPHVKVGYNADNFIEELDRLIEEDPAKVSSVLGKVLEAYEPDYDYEDRLKKLLIKLAESGRREDVLLYADRIRKLPGIDQLFKQLAGGII